MAKTFGLEKGQRAKLSSAVATARGRDEDEFSRRQASAAAQRTEIAFAQRLVAGDHAVVADALERHTDVGSLAFCVEGLDVLFTDDQRVIAMVDGLDLEDMPDRSVNMLQSGKASVKALTKTRVLELHRDNICSSAIRVALEFLQVLPIDAVEVVMHADLLNAATGHIRSEPVLYLRVAAQAISGLNLPRAEAVALVERLGGHYEWTKRDGLKAINLGAFNVPSDRTRED